MERGPEHKGRAGRGVGLLCLLLAVIAGACMGDRGERVDGLSPVRTTTEAKQAAQGPQKDTTCAVELVPTTVQGGSVASLKKLGQRFLDKHVDPANEIYDQVQALLDRQSDDFAAFNAFCNPEHDHLYSFEDIGQVQVCAFPTWGAPTSFFYEEWVLVGQVDDHLSWLYLGRSGPSSKVTEQDLALRRVSVLSQLPRTLWVEVKETETDLHDAQRPDGKSWVDVQTHWYGYVVAVNEAHELQPLAYQIPVYESQRIERNGRPDTGAKRYETQIDVSFPAVGTMRITARTDSLSNEQRCWIGTHGIALMDPSSK